MAIIERNWSEHENHQYHTQTNQMFIPESERIFSSITNLLIIYLRHIKAIKAARFQR